MGSYKAADAAIEVDVLICGAGPAGASLASFLGSQGELSK